MQNKLMILTIFGFAGRASRVPAVIALLAGALFLAACGGGGGGAPAAEEPAPADSPVPLGPIERVSLHSDGTQADSDSFDPAISGDGRYVAFASFASNLVAGDGNVVDDVFVRDTVTDATTRVSLHSDGTQATGGDSFEPAISGDGRYVAFYSAASNLVTGDSNLLTDVFLHDTVTDTTTRVSLRSDGTQATGGDSARPAISGDGRYVAFESFAGNLVDGDTNGVRDVFVRDTMTNTTTRVSLHSDGTEASGALADSRRPAISGDGRYVAFESFAGNLVDDDSNATFDVFVRDTVTDTTTRVSLDSAGIETNIGGDSFSPAISGDGRYVAFESSATNLVGGDTNLFTDVFVRDTVTGATTLVSVDSAGAQATGGGSFNSAISADGRYVAFETDASNLVAGDSNGLFDVFRAPAR